MGGFWKKVGKVATVVFPVPYLANKYVFDGIAAKLRRPNEVAPGRVSNTSCYGRTIPIVYGTTKIAGNLIYMMADGSKGQEAIVALCEGPITGIGGVWNGHKYDSDGWDLGVRFEGLGARPTQSIWQQVLNTDPTKALGYPGVAYAGHITDIQPGQMSGFSYEIHGKLRGVNTGTNTTDANPAYVLQDILSDYEYGAGKDPRDPSGIGFDAAWLVTNVGQDGTNASSYEVYVAAEKLWLSPAFTDQQPARDCIADILESTNAECVWTGDGHLRIVPLGDTAVGGYAPVTAAQYTLTTDDFVTSSPDEDPVSVEREPATECWNIVPVEFIDRTPAGSSTDTSLRYQAAPVESPEPVSVALEGERRAQAVALHSIHLKDVAVKVSGLKARMSAYARNTYSFSLGWRFLRLEPLDLVRISDPLLGISNEVVRIHKIEREWSDDQGLVLHVEAEQWPLGVGGAILHDTQSSEGSYSLPNPQYADPASQGGLDDLAALMNAVASDNKLTAAEKGVVLLSYHDLVDAQTVLEAQAENYVPSIAHVSYTNAINALRDYFTASSVPGSQFSSVFPVSLDGEAEGGLGLGTDYATEAEWRVVTQDIVGTVFRQKFSDAYAARTALLAAFADRNRTVSEDAAADAGEALTLAGSGTAVMYSDSPPGARTGGAALRVDDLWFSKSTSVAYPCPDLNCKGHDVDPASPTGAPLVGSYPHRGMYWAHKWTDLGSGVFAWRTADTEALVIASEIAAGAIVADKIAANAIDVSKLTVSNFDNLVPNPTCAITNAPSTAPEGAGLYNYGSGFSPSGWYRRVVFSGATTVLPVTGSIPAVEGDEFYLEARGFFGNVIRADSVRAVIRANGASPAFGVSPWLTTGTSTGEVLKASIVCPAGTTSITARIDYEAGAASAGDYALFSNFYLRRKVGNDGITTIDGGKITTGTIDAARIDTVSLAATNFTLDGVVIADVGQIRAMASASLGGTTGPYTPPFSRGISSVTRAQITLGGTAKYIVRFAFANGVAAVGSMELVDLMIYLPESWAMPIYTAVVVSGLNTNINGTNYISQRDVAIFDSTNAVVDPSTVSGYRLQFAVLGVL